jgi:hypothetical protein
MLHTTAQHSVAQHSMGWQRSPAKWHRAKVGTPGLLLLLLLLLLLRQVQQEHGVKAAKQQWTSCHSD